MIPKGTSRHAGDGDYSLSALAVAAPALSALLRHVRLLSADGPVEVAGIRIRPSMPESPCEAGFDDPAVYRRTSAVVYSVAALLSLILRRVVATDETGVEKEIVGFAFRDQAAWRERTPCDPNELLQYVAGPCRIACKFCYLKGNPPALRRIHTMISDREFAYRLALFSHGQRVFPKTVLSTDEQTTSPRLLPALRAVRTVTDAPVFIETNGVSLTTNMVKRLAIEKPVFVNVSVNTMNRQLRRDLMRDKASGRVRQALELLRETGIPYSASILPWHDIPLDDVEETIRLTASLGAGHIRIRLPGHTSHFAQEALFDLDTLWPAVIERLARIRPEVGCPILVEPGKYEQLLTVDRWELPVVLGVVQGSPASEAGVRRGDYLTTVNGIPMFWRSDGFGALVRLMVNRRDLTMGLLREGERLECRIRFTERDAYPYMASDHRSPYGIFLCDDIDRDAMTRLKSLLAYARTRAPVLVTSRLMERSTRQLMHMFDVEREFPSLRLAVIPNGYFGGNIFMGDLLVTDDVIEFIRAEASRGERPDLVILPSSAFNEHGRDLVGVSYRRIGHLTGVPAMLLPTRMITQ